MSVGAFLLGLTCLLPYPAIPIGNSTGLQAGSILAIFFIVTLHSRLLKRNVRAWLVLCIPLIASTFFGSFFGVHTPSLTNGLAVSIAWSLFTLPLAVTGSFVFRNVSALLVGVSFGVLLHVSIGVYQVFSFQHEVFPLIWLYQNPSFSAFDQDFAQTVALYIQRPFGLFPEPSAMATSIGPWLLLFFAYSLNLLPFRSTLKSEKWTMLCVTSAFIGGVWLLFTSRSGAALIISPALLVFFAMFLLKNSRSAISAYFGIIGLCVFSALIAGTAYVALEDRVVANFATDSSWSLRFQSIIGGFNLVTERNWYSWITGVGAGQSSLLMQSNLGLDAVWSVVFSYFIENGILGFLCWSVLVLFVTTAIWKSPARTVGLILLGFWLLSFTLVTSYFSLLSAWSFLGLLLNWDHLCKMSQDSFLEGQ